MLLSYSSKTDNILLAMSLVLIWNNPWKISDSSWIGYIFYLIDILVLHINYITLFYYGSFFYGPSLYKSRQSFLQKLSTLLLCLYISELISNFTLSASSIKYSYSLNLSITCFFSLLFFLLSSNLTFFYSWLMSASLYFAKH